MGAAIYGRPLARCNFPPVIRMGQRKIAKNLKSPKMYIATFFVYYTREYLIPTEFDTRLEKKDIYCKVKTNSKITRGKMQKTYYAI